jgi:cell division septation protein DedD
MRVDFFSRRWMAVTALLVGMLPLVAGCGGGDEEVEGQAAAETAQGGSGSMVPASVQPADDQQTAAAGTAPAAGHEPGESKDTVEETTSARPEPGAKDTGPTGESGGTSRTSVPETVPEPASDPAPAPKPSRPTSVPAGDGAYSLQVGSFKNDAYAQELQVKLRELGHVPEVEKAFVNGEVFHRVLLRGLATRDEAVELGEDLRAALGISYLVRKK